MPTSAMTQQKASNAKKWQRAPETSPCGISVASPLADGLGRVL